MEKKVDVIININVAGNVYAVKVIEEDSCQIPLALEYSQPSLATIPVNLKTPRNGTTMEEDGVTKEDDDAGEEDDDSINSEDVEDSCGNNVVDTNENDLNEVNVLNINNNCFLEEEKDNSNFHGEDNKHTSISPLVAQPPPLLLEAPKVNTVMTVTEPDLVSRVEDSLDSSNDQILDSSFSAHNINPRAGPIPKRISVAPPFIEESSLSEPISNNSNAPAHSLEPSLSGVMCSHFSLTESQMKGINLQVDLKTSQGRKIRRKQLLEDSETGLNTTVIPSMQELEPNPIQISQSSSNSSFEDIDSEVNSTFAVGTRLNINCNVKDSAILHKMIQDETEEFSKMLGVTRDCS